MKINRFTLFVIGLCVISIAFIYGCGNATGGGSSGSSVSNRTGVFSYAGTQASGDAWAWTIGTSEFIGTNETASFTITGEWSALSSGFSKAHVEGVFGSGGPTAGGYAYFLEFPKTLLLVKPAGSGDDRVLVCAASATTEPAQGQYLFVTIPKSTWEAIKPAFGTVEVTHDSSTPFKWQFDVSSYDITGEFISEDIPSGGYHFIYTNGTFTDESSSVSLEVFMTPSGMFLGDNGPGQGGFAGASYEGISISDIIPHQYKGIRFIYYPPASPGAPSTGETEAVTCHRNGTSTTELWATAYDNVDTGAIHQGKGYVTITFEASAVSGFSRGYVTGHDEDGNHMEIIQCVVSQVGPDYLGKMRYLLFGIGLEDNGRAFNFLFIQTDIP
jgi:hypothetical protein